MATPSRVVALFLAAVLLGSGFSTIEAPRRVAPASPEQQHVFVHLGDAGGVPATHEGSVEHPHLDDQPSQAQSDPRTESQALLPARPVASAPSSVMVQPSDFASPAAGAPFLAGPLRPPCSATLVG